MKKIFAKKYTSTTNHSLINLFSALRAIERFMNLSSSLITNH